MRTIPTGIYILLILSLLMAAVLTLAKSRTHTDRSIRALWTMFEEYVSQALVLMMTIAAIIQVTVRYVLSGYIVVGWTEEFALMALIWLAFWAGAAVSRQQDHIYMEVLYDLLPRGAQRACLIIGDLVLIGILGPIAWLGFRDAQWLDILFTVSLGVPVSFFAYAVPVGLTVFVIHGVVNLIDHLKSPLPAPHHLNETETAI